MKRTVFRTAASLLLLGLAATAAEAQQQQQNVTAQPQNKKQQGNNPNSHPESQPALVSADQMVFDRDLNIVTARGHVEIDQGGQVIKAEALSYNLKQDVIIATGHVSFMQQTGDLNFADYLEVTGDMKQATARGIRMLMFDDSRLAGNFARRTEGTLTVLDRAVYTACKACEDDPDRPPVWAIKADRIIHDGENHLVEYENAWLEMGGIPFAYTPYLSHADPTIKRVSGWLPPSVVNNNILGTAVRTPYFAVIDDKQDVTLTPMLTSNDDAMLAATWRFKDAFGEMKTIASITELQAPNYTGHGTIGWHIDSNALFDLDENWRAGAQIQRTSDINYLPTLGINTPVPYLTVRPYVEDFTYSNYFAVEAYSFQTLTSQTLAPGATPLPKDPVVLPMITYSYVGDTDSLGGYTSFDTHAAVISRLTDTATTTNALQTTSQVNTQTTWHRPFTTDDGELIRVTGSVRADAYRNDNVAFDPTVTQYSTRLVPDIAVDWRYPFTSVGEHSSQTFTPIIMASASPNTGNYSKIPNNDSLDFELDDVNIFSPTPSSGYDRLVTGPRVAYGAEYTVVNRGGESADFVLGQSYQASKQTELPVGTGLGDYMSDIVGRADISPSQNLVLQYRFRLDHDNLELRRSEVSASIGPRPLNLNIGYTFYDKLAPDSPYDAREQVSSTLSAQLTHYWSSQIYTIQNLGEQAGPLQSGVRLTYDDDCFTLTADAGSRHTTSAVFSVGHYLTLRIVFKTLGQLPVDLF